MRESWATEWRSGICELCVRVIRQGYMHCVDMSPKSHHKRLVVRSVVHKRSEWVKKVRVCGKVKVAGTQQIDGCWNHLIFFCPSQMKHRTGATINGRFWDRIYQWIYRHNTSNWPKTKHLRAEKIASATFRREVHKIQFWKIAKSEAFWHIDVENAGLWKSVLPCFTFQHDGLWSFVASCT